MAKISAKEAYESAMAYAKQREMVKAVNVLKGVQHPKCEALLKKIQQTPEYQKHQKGERRIRAMWALVFMLVVIVAIYYVAVFLPASNEQADQFRAELNRCATFVARWGTSC